MGKLLLHPRGERGLIHQVTPASAGWRHVGFDLWRLDPGEAAQGLVEQGREAILVVVEGKGRLIATGQDWGEMGARLSPFERSAPHALYLPQGAEWRFEAGTGAELAVCTAQGSGKYPPRRLGPQGIDLTPRGTGTNTRYINNIAMEARDVAESLLVTEVFTPEGHWSSWPAHRHDEDDYPRITCLEETYYHRLNPAQGFAFQRVWTEDGTLDETMAVADRDVTLVPRGHHPCGVPWGYELYYLNVMAGPLRKWRFAPHPDHAWIMERDAPA
ncbi:MAG: 5-deoxy-glucuronate isomerase [Rubellimicrobium sp.]|nr:5-deoxy-glucuronate isomerase [Rubellimicrobium sp.]